jgi:arsenate reductase (thioredoxin)
MPEPAKILFVCVGNACRSQMAEALARHLASDVIAASSAGVYPLGHIAGPTREVLLERGVSSEGQFSKGLHDDSIPQPPDRIINMSGIRGASLFAGSAFEDWDVEDPFGDDVTTYRRICDDIEARVRDLAARLRKSSGPDRAAG